MKYDEFMELISKIKESMEISLKKSKDVVATENEIDNETRPKRIEKMEEELHNKKVEIEEFDGMIQAAIEIAKKEMEDLKRQNQQKMNQFFLKKKMIKESMMEKGKSEEEMQKMEALADKKMTELKEKAENLKGIDKDLYEYEEVIKSHKNEKYDIELEIDKEIQEEPVKDNNTNLENEADKQGEPTEEQHDEKKAEQQETEGMDKETGNEPSEEQSDDESELSEEEKKKRETALKKAEVELKGLMLDANVESEVKDDANIAYLIISLNVYDPKISTEKYIEECEKFIKAINETREEVSQEQNKEQEEQQQEEQQQEEQQQEEQQEPKKIEITSINVNVKEGIYTFEVKDGEPIVVDINNVKTMKPYGIFLTEKSIEDHIKSPGKSAISKEIEKEIKEKSERIIDYVVAHVLNQIDREQGDNNNQLRYIKFLNQEKDSNNSNEMLPIIYDMKGVDKTERRHMQQIVKAAKKEKKTFIYDYGKESEQENEGFFSKLANAAKERFGGMFSRGKKKEALPTPEQEGEKEKKTGFFSRMRDRFSRKKEKKEEEEKLNIDKVRTMLFPIDNLENAEKKKQRIEELKAQGKITEKEAEWLTEKVGLNKVDKSKQTDAWKKMIGKYNEIAKKLNGEPEEQAEFAKQYEDKINELRERIANNNEVDYLQEITLITNNIEFYARTMEKQEVVTEAMKYIMSGPDANWLDFSKDIPKEKADKINHFIQSNIVTGIYNRGDLKRIKKATGKMVDSGMDKESIYKAMKLSEKDIEFIEKDEQQQQAGEPR